MIGFIGRLYITCHLINKESDVFVDIKLLEFN